MKNRRNRGKSRVRFNPGVWTTNDLNWGQTSAFNISSGNFQPIILEALVPQDEVPGQPQILGVVIDEVEIDIAFVNTSVAASNMNALIGVGLYEAEWDDTTATWSKQDPFRSIDACRKDWLWREVFSFQMATPTAVLAAGYSATSIDRTLIRKRIRRSLTLEEGSALQLIVSCTPTGAGATPLNDANVSFLLFNRWRRRNAV